MTKETATLQAGVGRTRSMGLQCPTILPLSDPALEEYTMRSRLSRSLWLAVFLFRALCKGEAPNRVTILYDAFGKSAGVARPMEARLHRDWSLYRGDDVRSVAKDFSRPLHLRRRWNSREYSLNSYDPGRVVGNPDVIRLLPHSL